MISFANIKFSKIQERIKSELNKRYEDTAIGETLTLVQYFSDYPLTQHLELTEEALYRKNTVPMVMLIGDKTGQVYCFSLEELLKEKI